MTNATIRYSGDINDAFRVSIAFFKKKSFLELSTLFSLTYSSYQDNKNKMISYLVQSNPSERLFDSAWGHQHISCTQNKKTVSITISSQMITLILFLKDPDAMLVYSEHMTKLGASVIHLINDLGIKQEFPECFV